MQYITQYMVVVATKPIGASYVFGTMLMDVVVFDVTIEYHRTRNCSERADQKGCHTIQTSTLPYTKVYVIMVDNLQPNHQK